MSDLIERAEAIDAMCEACSDWCDEGVCKKVSAIQNLPSAQPQRKMGKWIVYYECPKCGEITKDFTEYCPFCDADMRGEQDDS